MSCTPNVIPDRAPNVKCEGRSGHSGRPFSFALVESIIAAFRDKQPSGADPGGAREALQWQSRTGVCFERE
jgi:hypothetical protein